MSDEDDEAHVHMLNLHLHTPVYIPIPHPRNWRHLDGAFMFADDDTVTITINGSTRLDWSRARERTSPHTGVDTVWMDPATGRQRPTRFEYEPSMMVRAFRRHVAYLYELMCEIYHATPWACATFPYLRGLRTTTA